MDIPRTSTSHGCLAIELFAVLKCFTLNWNEIGYVQGMNVVASMLLEQNSSLETLIIMHSLMQNYGLEDIYSPGMPGLKRDFYIFMRL